MTFLLATFLLGIFLLFLSYQLHAYKKWRIFLIILGVLLTLIPFLLASLIIYSIYHY